MIQTLATRSTVSISEFKKSPEGAVKEADGPLAVLKNSEASFYAVPADLFEAMVEEVEDAILAALIEQRRDGEDIEVDWNDL